MSPFAHLVSGGKATVAQMFVNNSTGRRGLVCQYDVVCFDEVSGISFDQKDGVNIMKGYMESGKFSRGKESIAGEGGIVMVGNFDVDVEHQQRIGHLLAHSSRRDDTLDHPCLRTRLGRSKDESSCSRTTSVWLAISFPRLGSSSCYQPCSLHDRVTLGGHWAIVT